MNSRDFPTRPFVGASIAIFRNGQVLLAKRGATAGFGLYSLPGGLVELGESAEEAARREAREEVGVDAEIIGLAGNMDVIEKTQEGIRQHYVVLAFAAEWRSGEPRPSSEALDTLWADVDHLGALRMTKGLPEILRKARALVQTGATR